MKVMEDSTMREFTTDPIEGEVCAALAAYKWALVQANYRSLCVSL